MSPFCGFFCVKVFNSVLWDWEPVVKKKKKAIQDIDLESFISRFASESDRAAAVLGASLLDARLENLFKVKLIGDTDSLLGINRPLSTFSSRINLALALQWIDSETADDLNTIRDIRNDFAHHLDHELSFETTSIANRCENLHSASAHLKGYDEAAKKSRNFSPALFDSIKKNFSKPRWRYHIAVESIDHILIAVTTPNGNQYCGPSLIDECYESTANIQFKVNITGTVGGYGEK
jgi:hypothetical protein